SDESKPSGEPNTRAPQRDPRGGPTQPTCSAGRGDHPEERIRVTGRKRTAAGLPLDPAWEPRHLRRVLAGTIGPSVFGPRSQVAGSRRPRLGAVRLYWSLPHQAT